MKSSSNPDETVYVVVFFLSSGAFKYSDGNDGSTDSLLHREKQVSHVLEGEFFYFYRLNFEIFLFYFFKKKKTSDGLEIQLFF